MRTLDEVIKAVEEDLECANESYPEVFYDYDNHKDALHYLKVLQKMQKAQPVTKGEWNELYNNPLSWSELQHMDGKPVWATFDSENGTWYIAKVYDDEVVLYEWGQEFGERISGAWDYTPKRWQAYRKERS